MKAVNAVGNCFTMFLGTVFAAMGAYITLLGVGVIHTDPPNTGEARWMLTLFGLTFFLVGAKVFTTGATPISATRTLFFRLTQTLLSAAVVVLFGSIFVWSGLQEDRNASLIDHLIFVAVGTLIVIGSLIYALRQVIHLLEGESSEETRNE